MGSTRPERDAARARAEHIAAGRRFGAAWAAYITAGVPILPRDSTGTLSPWTGLDVRLMIELHESLGAVIATRRSYDGLRRRR